jgi:hypothetical protein
MSAKSRREVVEQARARYRFRGKEGRSRLLDEICRLCGYERKYVIKLLSAARSLPRQEGCKAGRIASALRGSGAGGAQGDLA